MTKKIYAIMVKKMVKVKKKCGVFEKTRGVFPTPRWVFPPHFQMGEKPPQGFFKKIIIKICSRNKFV